MKLPVLARAAPLSVAVVVLIAGGIQSTSWKTHHLTLCRETPGYALPADARTAWQQGLRFGLHCGLSCANLTALWVVIGVMDLRAMAFVTVAMTAERLAPNGERIAQAVGAVVAVAGLLMIGRAIGIG